MSIGFIVGFSIFLQFSAVLLSLRLMTSPRNRVAALLIMGACALSAARRVWTMTELLSGPGLAHPPIGSEVMALVGSLLMVLGLLRFEPRAMTEERPQDVDATPDTPAAMGELQQNITDCRSFFEAMPSGFAIHRMIVDGRGYPVDYVFLDVNPAFERLTGMKRSEIVGKRATEVLRGFGEKGRQWITNYGRVALTGQSMQFEDYAAPLQRWYSVQAYSPRRGYFVTIFQDVSERIQAEAAVRRGSSYAALSPAAAHGSGASPGSAPLTGTA